MKFSTFQILFGLFGYCGAGYFMGQSLEMNFSAIMFGILIACMNEFEVLKKD